MIFEIIKDPHNGVILGVRVFGIVISSAKKFKFWNRMYSETILDNISLSNKNYYLDLTLDKICDVLNDMKLDIDNVDDEESIIPIIDKAFDNINKFA